MASERIQEILMFQTIWTKHVRKSLLVALVCALMQPLLVTANEDPTEVAAAMVDEKYSEQGSDVKRLFASRCSWCHQGYGMVQADGPRLAGTDTSRDRVMETIAKGKSPMPGFRKQLKPWQIEALADYIKALPDE
jgi:mono/diheme cytochrome c family protein